MQIDGIRYDGERLLLTTKDPEAIRMVKDFKAGEYQLVRDKKHRSNDANAFAWAIIGQIAQRMQLDRNTVYRAAVCAVGASEMVLVREEAFDAFARIWAAKGLGWVAEKVDESGGLCYVNCYYGSSSYDTKQMSAFIDYLKQDAESIGIQIDSEQMRSLLEQWEEEHGC